MTRQDVQLSRGMQNSAFESWRLVGSSSFVESRSEVELGTLVRTTDNTSIDYLHTRAAVLRNHLLHSHGRLFTFASQRPCDTASDFALSELLPGSSGDGVDLKWIADFPQPSDLPSSTTPDPSLDPSLAVVMLSAAASIAMKPSQLHHIPTPIPIPYPTLPPDFPQPSDLPSSATSDPSLDPSLAVVMISAAASSHEAQSAAPHPSLPPSGTDMIVVSLGQGELRLMCPKLQQTSNTLHLGFHPHYQASVGNSLPFNIKLPPRTPATPSLPLSSPTPMVGMPHDAADLQHTPSQISNI
eukprot:gene17838-24222_t